MNRTNRSFDFTVVRAQESDNGDGLTLEGYAAVFDTPTEIHDWEGVYTESISRGAFKKTLSERTPVLQFDHGTHPMIGSIPLGVVQSASEDENGLFVRARLSDNWLVQPVREAIQSGSISGMSFQFNVTRDEWNKDRSARTIREVKLYELGPVVWPAYEQTTVGVRSIQDLLSCATARADLARALYLPEVLSDAVLDTSERADDTPPVPAPVVPDKKAAAAAIRKAQLIAMPTNH
jgi:HK97 family phage prohead protease